MIVINPFIYASASGYPVWEHNYGVLTGGREAYYIIDWL